MLQSRGPATPLSELGVERAREMMAAIPRPRGPEMHSVQDLAIVGPHGKIPLRIYYPHGQTSEKSAATVYLHGGGMIMGTIDQYDNLARNLAQASKSVVISVDYRLAPEHPYPVASDETLTVMRWIMAGNAPGIDPERVAVAGDSAGGSLAAGACLQLRDQGLKQPIAQFLFYPGLERDIDRPSTMQYEHGPILTKKDITWMKNMYLGEDPTKDTIYGVPALAKDLSGLTPTLIFCGSADPLIDSNVAFANRLQAAGNDVTFMQYFGLCHGFLSNVDSITKAKNALQDIGALMQNRMKN